MSRPFLARGLCLLFLSMVASFAFAHDREVDTRLARHLADDVTNARITRNDGVALKVAALLAADLLPEEYRGTVPHCGTGLMLDLMTELAEADPNVQQFVRYTFSSPAARRAMTPPDADALPFSYREVAREMLRRSHVAANAAGIVVTAHFAINYETAGGSAASPAYVAQVGAALEQSYAVFVNTYGFAPPTPTAIGVIDVVITDNVPCPIGGPVDVCRVSGAAVPPGFSANSFPGPAIFLQNNFTPSGLQVTAAHEFFHLLQYENASPLAMGLNYWWCEGSATAAEDVVYPNVNAYIVEQLQGNDGFYARTNYSIGSMTYESVLYHMFLMEKYSGGNPTILREILTELDSQIIPSIAVAIQSVLASHGTNANEAMKHFALWNFHSASRTAPPNSYADSNAPGFPNFTNFQAEHNLSPSVTSVPATPTYIMASAAHYFRFRPDATMTNPRKLTIKTNTVSLGHIRGWVVIRRFNGNHEIRELTGLNTNATMSEDETTINDFGFNTIGEVVLILANGFTGSDVLLAHYEAKLATAIDLAFAMDTTGSMGGSITAIKNTAIQAMQTLGVGGADFRIAITEFKDHPVPPYGSPGDFPYRADSPFSNQPSVILSGVNMLAASGGNDWPESQFSGVMGAINAVNITSWRSDAKKAIIVMTDAPPHNPEPFTGYTTAAVIAAANTGGISLPPNFPAMAPAVSSVVRRPRSITANAGNPIRIYGIVIGGDSEAYDYLSQLAEGTGGKVYSSTYSISDITEALLDAVGDIGTDPEDPPTPTNQPPNVANAIGSPSPLWPANHKMVPIIIANVSDPEGDTFTISITGVTQDEPVNKNGKGEPDASGVGTGTASVRAERDGNGNGRVYRISFTATDSKGASSTGSVTVCVPHDQGGNSTCTDDGQSYTSTAP